MHMPLVIIFVLCVCSILLLALCRAAACGDTAITPSAHEPYVMEYEDSCWRVSGGAETTEHEEIEGALVDLGKRVSKG
jgi:hypothetical protein